MAAIGLGFVRVFDGHFGHPLPGNDQGEMEYAITAPDWRRLLAE